MKIRGRFEKQVLHVGLSEELPLVYVGPEEKYALADLTSRAHVHYAKNVLAFELDITTDELISLKGELMRTVERLRCYQIVSAMPDEALREVEETLLETYEHYKTVLEVAQRPALPAPKVAQATVSSRVRT